MTAHRVGWMLAVVLAGCGATPDEMNPYDASDDAADVTPDTAFEETTSEAAVDVAVDVAADVVVDVTRDAPADASADVRDATSDARDAVTMDVRDVVTDVRDATSDTRDAVTTDARDGGIDAATDGSCAEGMALVEGRVCVDRWEATLVEVTMDGGVTPWSPYYNPGTRNVRAVSRGGAVPQAYVSGADAQRACTAAGKRLCRLDEWLAACRGPSMRTYPYGNTYVTRRCNEARTPHPVIQFFGTSVGVFTSTNMNNPGINMQANTVSPGGMFWDCVSEWGVYDMVGNVHEWIDDPAGTFKGGFYVDAEINGRGCLYTTTAHSFTYRDYSTGFRCCSNVR